MLFFLVVHYLWLYFLTKFAFSLCRTWVFIAKKEKGKKNLCNFQIPNKKNPFLRQKNSFTVTRSTNIIRMASLVINIVTCSSNFSTSIIIFFSSWARLVSILIIYIWAKKNFTEIIHDLIDLYIEHYQIHWKSF